METIMKKMGSRAAYMLLAATLILTSSLTGFSQTAASTDIKNVATATYSDGSGNDFDAVSNEVTVTVARVAGLTITPDGQSDPTVVAGQASITKTFRVTNVGNFTDQVRFLAGGASITVSGPGTVTAATVDGVDIFTNAADVLHTLNQNGFVDVIVTISVNTTANPGETVQVFLGDADSGTNFDNIATNGSSNNVSTVSTGAVNGSREARGDISAVVDNDALPRVTLSAPAGPLALGSTITYTATSCNDGERDLLPVSPDTQIYVYAPIPAGTTLTNVSSLPVGTQYTTSPLTTGPRSATWTSVAPGDLSTVTRIRIPVGASITSGTCVSAVTFDVAITTNNANLPILEIVDIFGNNSVGSTLTDQSGDNTPNKGDGNANFDEPTTGGSATPTQGFEIVTTITQTGGVLNGPNGSPAATGPTDNNDDFTNKSVTTGITVATGGVTTADGSAVFINSVQNTGNADDTFTLTAPTVPSGFTVEISTDGGTTWVTVSGGGSTTINVAFGATGTYQVRVTEPAGTAVLTGFDAVIRATSGIDPTKTNDTINRLYTGFIVLEKSAVVTNGTGVGGASDAVPGAVITFTIKYTNISEASSGGSVGLTASNLVITEDGAAAPNTWAAYTTQVVGSGRDYTGASGTTAGSGVIAGDSVGSTLLTDTVSSVAPGAVGRFVFQRRIN